MGVKRIIKKYYVLYCALGCPLNEKTVRRVAGPDGGPSGGVGDCPRCGTPIVWDVIHTWDIAGKEAQSGTRN